MRNRVVRLALLFGVMLSIAGAAPGGGDAQRPRAPDAAPAPALAPPGSFTMALTGDSIITRRLSVYRESAFTKLVDIIRGADVAFTNLEMLFHDYEPYAMNESGGTYMRADPALVQELVWAGFDMVSRANNHAGDYGVQGMRLTTAYVAKAGLVQAGVGESLMEAREAKFLDTPKSRVALVSAASTFPDHSRAGSTRGDMPARPGLNPLRFTTTYVVTPDRLEALRTTFKELGMNLAAQGDSLRILNNRFIAGERPEVRTEPNKQDSVEITSVISNASRQADYTIVTLHGHEGGRTRFEPAQFMVAFAHAAIDAGADVVVGHGPHVLRGVEIYKGRPILYSVGDFIFQNETLLRLPNDNYEPYQLGATSHVADFNDRRYDQDRRGFPADRAVWEGVVAVVGWHGRTLEELTLYPITLGFGQSRTVRGRPLLAEGATAQKIVDDMIRMSKALGTEIVFERGVGKVVLPTGSARSPTHDPKR